MLMPAACSDSCQPCELSISLSLAGTYVREEGLLIFRRVRVRNVLGILVSWFSLRANFLFSYLIEPGLHDLDRLFGQIAALAPLALLAFVVARHEEGRMRMLIDRARVRFRLPRVVAINVLGLFWFPQLVARAMRVVRRP